jgi:hypothetical protein
LNIRTGDDEFLKLDGVFARSGRLCRDAGRRREREDWDDEEGETKNGITVW